MVSLSVVFVGNAFGSLRMKIKELHMKFEDGTTRVYEWTDNHLTIQELLAFIHYRDKQPQRTGWTEEDSQDAI